jgi:hypothetical protein
MTAQSGLRREQLKKAQQKFLRYMSFGGLVAFAAVIDRLWNGIADAAKPFMWSAPLMWAADILIGLAVVLLMAVVWAYFLEKLTGIRIGLASQT